MKSMKLATKIFLAVTGVLLAAAGILCLANPLGAVSTVAWLIGLVLLVSGIGTAIAAANATIAGGFAAAVTIHVGDGTYDEHSLLLEKPITVVGESGNRDAVIVNPNGSASNPRRAFTLNHAAATVSGITMKNGHARGSGNLGAGGNVRIDSNGGVVTNCVVANGYAAGGGNIFLNGAGALVVDCVATNGTADW